MQKKTRSFTWLILSLFFVLAFVLYARVDLQLNDFSVQTLKAEKNISIPQFDNSVFNCKVRWLRAAQAEDLQALSQLLPCSPAYMDMIRALAPTDAELAAEARALYPDLPEPLYWLAESQGGYMAPVNLPVYQQIVTEHPAEGLAWCYLGYQYERDGNIQASLDARINCCFNGDPGSNGCYHAGRLYEQLSDHENAIKYYLLSKWTTSREKGLDLKLRVGNPN